MMNDEFNIFDDESFQDIISEVDEVEQHPDKTVFKHKIVLYKKDFIDNNKILKHIDYIFQISVYIKDYFIEDNKKEICIYYNDYENCINMFKMFVSLSKYLLSVSQNKMFVICFTNKRIETVRSFYIDAITRIVSECYPSIIISQYIIKHSRLLSKDFNEKDTKCMISLLRKYKLIETLSKSVQLKHNDSFIYDE